MDGTLDAAVDARVEAAAAKATQRHMAIRDLHSNRATAANRVNRTSKTFTAKGLRYRVSDDPVGQDIVEEMFFTVDPDEAAAVDKALRHKILTHERDRPAWVPSRSTHNYTKSGSKRGVQLEKLIPTQTTKTDDLDGLLRVSGIKNGLSAVLEARGRAAAGRAQRQGAASAAGGAAAVAEMVADNLHRQLYLSAQRGPNDQVYGGGGVK